MLELDGSIWFRSGARTWGGSNRIELLAQIEATGSITAAARATDMSYKGAWDAIDAMNNLAGEPLVLRAAGGKGGGGTLLTDRARRLVTTFRALEAEHQRFLQQLAQLGTDASDLDLMKRLMLKTSARNKLWGTVIAVRGGAVNDEVTVRIAGGHIMAATITHASVQELGLSAGKQAIALVKASSVLVALADEKLRLSARNQLAGTITAITPGAVNAEVIIDLPGGACIAAIVTQEGVQALGLEIGMPALAVFKASSVILGTLD